MVKNHKYKILIFAEMISLLLMLPGCFQEEKEVYFVSEEDFFLQNQQYTGTEMELSPGVYQLRINTTSDLKQEMYVELVHDLGYYKSLRGNGVIIFPGAEYTDFEVYVTDTLPDVRVQCTLNGEDQDPAVSISVCKTNLGNRILVFLAIILFVLMDFLVLYRKYIVEGSVSIRQQIVFWVLLGSVFLAYFPYLTDYFSLGVDTTYHLLRIEGLKNTLEQGGHFPTRIHAYYNYGHGSLIPSTYSDLFLYFPALLRLTGFSAMTAYKMFVFAVVAAVAVISYVSFKRCMKDSYAALFASVVCLFSPYFLSNVYHRGAIGEALALAFVPPVCCGMYLLFTEENDVSYKYHKWWIVAGISGLLYSHLLSAEVVIFFMLLVCAAKWKKTFRRQTFWQLAESVLLVILLNCWYWLPMLYLMGSETYQLWEGYSKSIQESGLPFSDMVAQLLPESQGVPTFLGAGMTVAVVAYPFLRVRGILQKDRKEQILVRSCNELWVLTVLAVVISTKYFPWDALWKLPFISFFVSSLQFPAHFMVPGAALCAMFAGFLLLWLKSIYLQTENKRSGQVIVGVLVSLVISGMVYQVNSIAINYAPAYLYTAENMGTVHSANRFFLSAECDLKEFQYHRPVAEEGLKYTDYALNGTKATLNIENTVSEMRYLEIPLTAYRGYELQASSDQGGQPYITEARGAHGDIRVAIPGDYEGNITVSYKGPILFHIAEGISIISFISFALWETLKKRARYRNRLLHSR